MEDRRQLKRPRHEDLLTFEEVAREIFGSEVGAHYYLGRPLPFPSAPRRRATSPLPAASPRPSTPFGFVEQRPSSSLSFTVNPKRQKRWSTISSLSSLSSHSFPRPSSPSLSSTLFTRPSSPSSSQPRLSKRYSVDSLPPISLPLAPPARLEEQFGEVYGELVDVDEMYRRKQETRRRKSELMRACGNYVIGEEEQRPEIVQVHTFGTAY
ncbi:hypothetical protein NBRC10513v2_007666 [Rhodotorula toruloides]|uniref:Uncharacterized protein n=1 Tax=Rhodotorula toruloides TaxID=5286 RepID=A0A0K3CUI0_RHOTO|nr:hypothetical protein AAT19DRAFT_11115 [Rhodotorula toruloides]